MSNENIAVLDDDASIRAALSRLLETHSYRVQSYAGGQQFIDSLGLLVPDCLILDLDLETTNGDEVLHYFTDTGARIPTVILTGFDELEPRERCRRAGAVAFLVKPVTEDQLLGTIQTALSGRLPH